MLPDVLATFVAAGPLLVQQRKDREAAERERQLADQRLYGAAIKDERHLPPFAIGKKGRFLIVVSNTLSRKSLFDRMAKPLYFAKHLLRG
ncbi:hypothetical protein EV561_1305 [Rhizobium sp. BK376]|nr:hypothetical protein EV561_1305 [Rhizobium sp. BK376]